jgi:hypothetical protein
MSKLSPKDIPFFKEFKSNRPIEIQTPSGIVQLFPHDLVQGTGEEMFRLTIHGICISKVESTTQCFVYCKGTRCDGYFLSVKELKGAWEVLFETEIPVAEYWK